MLPRNTDRPTPAAAQPRSVIRKHSVMIAGHPTSISLEEEFWQALKALAAEKGVSVAKVVEEIDGQRVGGLSSAIRVHILKQLQHRLADDEDS